MCDMGNNKPLSDMAFYKQFAKRSKKISEIISKNGEKFRVYRGVKINKGY